MKKQLVILLRAAVFGFLALGFASSSFAVPTISFDPATTIKPVGETFYVNVFGDFLVDLYAFQFSVSYDPAVLHAVDISEGAFLATAGTTFFIAGAIDNLVGLISFTGDTLIGAISGANGSGILASVEFEASDDGLSELTFQDVMFLDSSLNEMTISNLGGSVSIVRSGGNVPEPSIPSLLLVGGVVLVLMNRNRLTRQKILNTNSLSSRWSCG
jgi:hypothetical protein